MRILAFTLLILIGNQLSAQFILSKSKSAFNGIRFYGGYTEDRYPNLDAAGLLSMIRPGQDVDFDLNDYESESGYTAVISGGNLGVDLLFSPLKDGNKRTNHEIRVGFSANIGREVMIDVYNNDQFGYYDYANSVTLCVIENEFNLQGSYLFRAPFLWNAFDVYAGPGVQIGSTFGNEFIFLGSNEFDPLVARNSAYVRARATAGMSLNIWNFFTQLEGSAGVGSQLIYSGGANALTSYSINLSIGYRIN